MPALKLTKTLYLDHRIDKELIQNVKEYEEKNQVYTNFLQLLTAENAKQQIEKLKEVTKEIGKICQESELGNHVPLLLGKYLVHLFFVSTTKNPARRVIISAFQSFPEQVQASVIGPNIEAALRQFFQQPIRRIELENSNEPITREECLDLRHNVETVSALIENFPLGENCVIGCCLEILSYLGKLQQVFYNTFGPHLSPVQQNEAMHHCLETVKLTNRVCQRSSVTMETRLNDPVVMEDYLQTVGKFITTDIAILQTEEFLLDCKTTSGMNICLLLKYTSVGHRTLAFLSKTVFRHVDCFLQSYDQVLLPDWLTGFNINQLSVTSLSESSHLCMCYGILTMVSMETLLLSVDGKCVLLDVLLPEFLLLTKRCTDVCSKLLAAKSVCVLTQRVRSYFQKGGLSCCDPTILQRFHGQSADTKTILDYVWTSWEDSVDAIRFTVKDLFENVVSVHIAVSPTDKEVEDPFLCHLTKSILTDVSWSCKGKYGTLAVLVSHIGSARMLAMHDGMAAEILEQLKEHTLSCYASDLYESLFRSHQSRLKHDGNGDAVWYNTWVDPVITVLCGAHKLQKKHSIEYVLPKLLKTGQDTLHYMISTLTAVIDKPAVGGYDKQKLTQTENQLGALVMCLRRARVMGQLKMAAETQGQKSKLKERPAHDTQQSPRVGHTDITVEGTGKQMPRLWCRVVNVDLLQQALVCKDEQIRLDAFALLCESQKTSETISDTELDLVQTFVPQNLNSHNPAFRQFFLSHLKKLISRMKESSIALKRQLGKNKEAATSLQMYKAFLSQLTKCLFSSLYPGCVFAKKTTCLGTLDLILNAYRTQMTTTDHDYSFYGVVRQCDITSLLECLTDTYEDNKQAAARILISCSQANKAAGVMDQKMTADMMDLAFQLAQSTRPQDCLTAAYLFNVLMHQPSVFQVLQIRVAKLCSEPMTETDSNSKDVDGSSDNVDNKATSHKDVEGETKDKPQNADLSHGNAGNLAKLEAQNDSVAKGINIKFDKSDKIGDPNVNAGFDNVTTASDNSVMYTDLTTKLDKNSSENMRELSDDYASREMLWKVTDSDLGRKYVLLCLLLHSLQEQVKVARTDLIVAAANRPLYPTMLCMRYCLMQVNFRNIPEETRPHWQTFFARLITLCLEISAVVSPVVQNSSPEGNVPLDEIPGGRCIMEDPSNESLAQSHSTVMLMPEYLIVCCWRSIKEISLIFGQMTTDLPIDHTDLPIDHTDLPIQLTTDPSSHKSQDPTGLLTLKQVLDIGNYFTVQLLESVHRGAFELAYAGFVKLTDMLWRSSIPNLPRLPKKWLNEVMLDIKSGSPDSKLCATRRSAGVPFYVQALVSTEPISTGRACFRDTMEQLLILAFDETVVTADRCSAKVHALNILRALFKDSRLKDDVAPYVADGLKVAILGFKSVLWAVRNSATLLMTAMMTRIFGVKRSRDETSFSRKNCQTGKTFFFKYPSLYQFLLDQLSEATQDLRNQLHPGLFPILMVLGRLFPSTMEGTDTSLNLAAFIPLVIKCSSSPVLKTRVMSARALQPLVEKDHVTKVFTDLFSLLPCQSGEPTRQNQIHGVLLQVKEMLGAIPQLPQSVRTSVGHIVSDLWTLRQEQLISRANPCLSTRKEALEVTAQILTIFGPRETIQEHFEAVLQLEVMEEAQLLSHYQYCPALSEFRTSICNLYFNLMMDKVCDKHDHGCVSRDDLQQMDEVSLAFLKSDSYEVRKTILLKMTDLFERNASVYNVDGHLRNRSEEESPVMKGANSIVENLPQSYVYLLTMANEETHEDCQVHLFRLLAIHSMSGPALTEDQSGGDLHQSVDRLCQFLDRLCQRIENQCLSDTVLAAMIDYAGSLLLSVCLYCAGSKTGNQQTPVNQSTVTKFLGMVESYSRSDCSSEIHMACVHTLQKTCLHIMKGKEGSFIDCHGNRRAVFRSTVALLQADDPDVRDAAADIQCIVSQNRLNVRAHSYVCMGLFLEEWAELQTSTDVAVASLCQLMHEQGDKQEALEERLFDRGEMNAYRDEIDLLQNIDAVIMKVLSTRLLQGRQKVTSESIPPSRPTSHSSHSNRDFVQIVDDCITNTDREVLGQYHSSKGFAPIFENMTEYQKSVLSLYQLLLLIKYAKVVGDAACTQKCTEEVGKLELGLHGDHVPTLLRDTLETVNMAYTTKPSC